MYDMDLIFLMMLMNTSSIFSADHLLTQSVLSIDDLSQLQQWQQDALPKIFDIVLTAAMLPEPMNAACRYAMYNGGKRVRPLLVLASFLTVCSSASNGAKQMAMVYRAITGACQYGTKQFIESKGGLKKKYTLKEILEQTNGAYGSERFKEVVRSK